MLLRSVNTRPSPQSRRARHSRAAQVASCGNFTMGYRYTKTSQTTGRQSSGAVRAILRSKASRSQARESSQDDPENSQEDCLIDVANAATRVSEKVPSFQAHSPVKTVFPKNAKNARKSQNTPSTNPYQNETQFSPLSLKSRTSRHPRQPKSALCPPVISGTNPRASSLKSAKFRHGTAGLSNAV